MSNDRYEHIRKVMAECRDIAMEWTMRGRIPECGKFGQIAQDLDYVCAELENSNPITDDEELRRDAERYRWLRDPCCGAERVIFYCRGDYGRGLMSGSMLDAAIDAAMQRTSGREGEQWTPTQAYVHAAIGNWMRSGDTGTSSETMAAIALGADSGDFGAPYDPSDFGRCYRLVQAIPAIRDAFPRIAELVPAFAGILREWDALVAIYLRDLPSGKSGELYQRIKTLRTMSNSPGEGEQ